MPKSSTAKRSRAGSERSSTVIVSGHFIETRKRVVEAKEAWDRAKTEWQAARVAFRAMNPMNEDYPRCVAQLQRATDRYVKASEMLLRICEKVDA